MIDKKTLIKVTNRDSGSVGYVIPDLNNLYRRFSAGETKTLTFEELEKLSWIPGGKRILTNYLKLDNEEAVAELLETQLDLYIKNILNKEENIAFTRGNSRAIRRLSSLCSRWSSWIN